jgi:hypothetical protein
MSLRPVGHLTVGMVSADTQNRTLVLGAAGTTGRGVHRALHRPPRDFAEYAATTAATGVWIAPAGQP